MPDASEIAKSSARSAPGQQSYLEKTLDDIHCQRYEFYDLAEDWASWIAETYAPRVVRQPTGGYTLASTANEFCDLVASHGVFVYIPMLRVLEYIKECARVTRIGGLGVG